MHDAEYEDPAVKEASYGINLRGESYEITKDGTVCESKEDVSEAIFNLQWIMHKEALKSITDRVRIHTACGELEGNRFLVAGDKGVGKTTLMMRLIFSGFRILSDELALVKDGSALPFPRRFHIKQESLGLLPELSELFKRLPTNMTSYGHNMYSFSPKDAGFEWKVDEARVRALFYIEPNHQGKSRIEECPGLSMVQRLMPMSFLSEEDDHLKIDKLCSMVDGAECYVLHVGDLDGAVCAMQEKMSVI